MKLEEQELIEQLPIDNPKRNAWLVKHGIGVEVERLRVVEVLKDTSTTPAEKADRIVELFRPSVDKYPQPYYQPPQQAPRFKNSDDNKW